MVLPSRHSTAAEDGDDENAIPAEVLVRKRPAPAFPDTPHPQKRLCTKDDTPPTAETAHDDEEENPEEREAYDENVLVNEMESPPRQEDEDDEEQPPQDDLDWDKLAQSEPARTDIPVFLAALARKEQADERFAAVLDEAHSSLLSCVNALLQTVADVHNMQRERMDAMEADIKHNLVCNDEARAQMQVRLQESATAAQGLFQRLLQRVTEPLQTATTRMQETMQCEQQQSTTNNE